MNLYKNATILVTGGTGSIGSEIVRQLLKFNPKAIRVYSRDDTKQFYLEHELYAHREKLRFLIGDVRDRIRLKRAMKDVDYVFSSSALKHVPSCERNPFEAVKTNIIGTQNVIETAIECDVKKVIVISTDKATNPLSAMGVSKLMAERLVSAVPFFKGKSQTQVCAVRFGNVMNSRGSVIPLWLKQLKNNQPITITDPEMRRYSLTIQQAVKLVFKAVELSYGGEIFVLKMPIYRVQDLAEVVLELYSKKFPDETFSTRTIGIRPGEKIHESLMTYEESENAMENEEMFIILPNIMLSWEEEERTYITSFRSLPSPKEYSTRGEKLMTKEEIKKQLKEVGVL